MIDIDNPSIGGQNANLAPGSLKDVNNWPVAYSFITLLNYSNRQGLASNSDLIFATGTTYSTPSKYALGDYIGPSSGNFRGGPAKPLFNYFGYVSPNFGPSSYMGFRLTTTGFGTYYTYGWVEVTWDGANFEILSAAYEDTPNTSILAGDTGAAPVPEPASSAVVALLMGGTALRQWRKKRRDQDQVNRQTLAS
jgi:hypothetical protein